MVGTTLKSTSPVNGIDLDLIQQAVTPFLARVISF